MEYVELTRTEDIDRVLALAGEGLRVEVECGDESAPDGSLEPMVELLQELLDRVIFHTQLDVIEGERVPHPSLGRKYLRKCVVEPDGSPGNESGVREPLRPRPSGPTRLIALPMI